MYCTQCGTTLAEEAAICHKCGRPVNGEPENTPVPQQTDIKQNVETVGPGGTAIGSVTGDVIIDPKSPPDELLKAYYRSLAAECNRLPLGVIYLRFEESEKVEMPLPQVYIDLQVKTPPAPEKGEAERQWMIRLEKEARQERLDLLQKLPGQGYHKIVLLGEAGSGKTTFVNYLAYLLAAGFIREADVSVLPVALRGKPVVRLALRDVAALCERKAGEPCGGQLIWEALQGDIASRLGKAAAERLVPYLQDLLIRQGGVILLDGLDEVPEAQQIRQTLVQAVQDFAGQLKEEKTWLAVTARPYAYYDPAWHLPGFTTLTVATFDQDQIKRFIGRWYQALGPLKGWQKGDTEARSGSLKLALQQRPYLADLASRPLLLTLMASLHSGSGKLPEDRADLYEETVSLLLSRWQRHRQRVRAGGQVREEPGILQVLGVDEDRLRGALEELAFKAHERQGQGAQRDQAPADISRGDVLEAFEPILSQVKSKDLLAYLQDRAGLLAARNPGVYVFPHRSFQEYLAACYLTNRASFAGRLQELVYADPDWWREVFLLAAGRVRRSSLDLAAGVVQWLLPDDPSSGGKLSESQWRGFGLAGQALLELRLPEKAGDQQYYLDILNRSRRWLVQTLSASPLPARERAAAGDTLAALGDPRFDPHLWYLPSGPGEPLLGFVPIPAGPFTMGSKDKDGLADNDEKPQHQVTLPTYYLARYPVTVAQFNCFIQERGRPPEDPDSLKDPDNHPVRYVTWYEARDYCRWLGEKLKALSHQRSADSGLSPEQRLFWQGLVEGKLVIGLPSEAEWEKAARGGDGRIYPWGDQFDPDKANAGDTGLGTTSTVGCFPAGASPYGLLDMSGNLWEWTRSLWRKGPEGSEFNYPYKASDGREDQNARDDVPRVVRGGSFSHDERNVRCAFRPGNLPRYWVDYVGFRAGASTFFAADMAGNVMRLRLHHRGRKMAERIPGRVPAPPRLAQAGARPGKYSTAPRPRFVPGAGRRLISAVPFRDRVVHHALCRHFRFQRASARFPHQPPNSFGRRRGGRLTTDDPQQTAQITVRNEFLPVTQNPLKRIRATQQAF